jgi:uncharacterized protein YegP (UPF0339 family)
MAGSGEVYTRSDGKYAFRVKASNGEVVATDGGQGYEHKHDALHTLEKLIRGEYDGPIKQD